MANGNGKKSKKKIIIFSIIGAVLVGLAALVFLGSKRETIVTVQTEKTVRRNITQIVSATGKIQPETQVKINAEVSGEIIDLPVGSKDDPAQLRSVLLSPKGGPLRQPVDYPPAAPVAQTIPALNPAQAPEEESEPPEPPGAAEPPQR